MRHKRGREKERRRETQPNVSTPCPTTRSRPFTCIPSYGRASPSVPRPMVRFVVPQDVASTLESLATSEEAADAQDAADTSCGVLEEGQAEDTFLGGETESKTNSVDL